MAAAFTCGGLGGKGGGEGERERDEGARGGGDHNTGK